MRSTLKLLSNRAPVPLSPRVAAGLPAFFHPNNAATQMQAYGAVGTLYSIVHRISESTSQVPWRLYRKSSDGRRRYEAQESRVEVTGPHAALSLWRQPNPWETTQGFVEATQQHLDLVGEGIWVIATDPRIPTLPLELWNIRPDRMVPVPHPTEFIAGWVYNAPGGEQVPLQVGEVIQIKYPHPLDPYRGLGPVQAILTDLDSARYSAEWNRAFFENSAEPGGIIEFPEAFQSDEEFNQFAKRWREQHQGVNAAHRIAILEGGSWKDRQMSMRDMQFAELRKVSREVIREAFGVHGHVLGLSDDINKSNAEAGEKTFGKLVLRPRLCRIKEAVNTRLLPKFGVTAQGLEFDHDDPEPPDREGDNAERLSKAEAFSMIVGAGVDITSAAEVVGLPAMTAAPTLAAPEPIPAGQTG